MIREQRFLAAYLRHCKMSVAKKEEVCGHPRRLGVPAVGVPIKKRPVFLSDKSVPSGLVLPMKPSSTATGISVSAAGAGCSKEPFLNRSKSDVPHQSVSPFASEKNGVLLNFSSVNPSCGESGRGRSVAPIVKSQSEKFLTLDLQLTSRENSKINNSPPVKKEKVDQVISIFPSARPPKDIQTTLSMESPTNSSLGKLSNLDLNVSLDPVDHLEGLPAMQTSSNGLYHRTFQHQKAQVPLVAPISTTSSRLSLNIDSTVNLSSTCQFSCKSGEDDVTLDLQLKPPTRPVLGISWKGLAPAPELSLSLFGNHTDEPKDPSEPDAIFKPEPVERAKKMSGEVATPGSDKSPAEKILKPVPCNANPRMTLPSTTVPGNVNLMPSTLVKKEPEEPSRQNIQKNAEKAPLFEQQTVGLVSNRAEFEKTGDINQVLGEASFDLNSEILRNNSIHNGLEVVTDNVPAQTNMSCDVVCTENMPGVSDVEKFIKQEEITADTPSPVIATASGQPALSIAKSLLLEGNVGRPAVGSCESPGQPTIIAPAVGSCESARQPTIHTSEPACCNPVEASTDCEPTVSHVHARENMTYKSCGAKVCDISRSSSKPLAKSLVLNCLDRASFDVMSQGSASMDCSDDGDNVVSQLPITSNPHVELLGNSQNTEANNLSTEHRKEDDIDMHHDCSSVKNKVHMQGIDNVKHVNTKDVIATLSGEEEHESEVSVNEKSKDKQLLASDKSSPPNNTDVAMQDVKIATVASSADLKMSSALGTSASTEIVSTGQSNNTFDNCAGKSRIPMIKSERSQSPDGKQAANCSEGNAKVAAVAVKSEHGTENEEIARTSNLHPSDSILAEDSHLDGASSSQPHSECTKSKSACEGSEHEKSKPDSCMTSSVQNEKDGQVNVSHWREVANACVNRNERWERFMQSEREKHNEEYPGGRHASDMINQRRTDHRYSGRGAGYHGHPRNFQGPRMNDEFEIDFTDGPLIGRRRPFENGIGHLHRVPHRRLRSPPNQMSGCLMRDMDHDRFSGRDILDPRLLAHGQMEDFPDDMMEESFFIHHPQHALGDHPFIRRDRSHSPEQRRGGPMHFHQGRSPEAMHRPPPLNRTDRPYLPHQRHTRRRGSPFDQIGRDERGIRRCGMHQGVQDDGFEHSLHPAQLAELHAEAELAERRKFGERRAYRRSLEDSPTGNKEMMSYHGEGDMHFTEGDGVQREADGRFRNKLEHRARGEHEDGYRHRGPQGWRDGNSNDSRPKKRRY